MLNRLLDKIKTSARFWIPFLAICAVMGMVIITVRTQTHQISLQQQAIVETKALAIKQDLLASNNEVLNILRVNGEKAAAIVDSQTIINDLEASPYDGIHCMAWGGNLPPSSLTSLAWTDDLMLGTKDLWFTTLFYEITTAGRGIDINDLYGGLTQWLIQWTMALTKAKQINSPGIIFDPEIYSNDALGLTTNAALSGLTQNELEAGLQAIGAQMIDIANNIYPTVTILDLFGMVSPTAQNGSYLTCVDYYLATGMLARAKETASQITYVAGGELDIHYWHSTVEHLIANIVATESANAEALAEYPNLKVGAPFFPWNGIANTTGAFLTYLQGQDIVDFADVYEMYPVLNALNAYVGDDGIIWTYGDPSNGFQPFHASIGPPFTRVFAHAKYREQIVAELGQTGLYDVTAALADHDKNISQGEYVRAGELQ
jgi:hypothetical protein